MLPCADLDTVDIYQTSVVAAVVNAALRREAMKLLAVALEGIHNKQPIRNATESLSAGTSNAGLGGRSDTLACHIQRRNDMPNVLGRL